jgi:hypothetical protein
MRSLKTKLVLSALGILTMFASPACAQEPHYHHRHHASLQQSDPVGPNQRGIYNMMVTPDIARTTDNPAATGGGSVGYNEMLHDDAW